MSEQDYQVLTHCKPYHYSKFSWSDWSAMSGNESPKVGQTAVFSEAEYSLRVDFINGDTHEVTVYCEPMD